MTLFDYITLPDLVIAAALVLFAALVWPLTFKFFAKLGKK